MSPSLLDPAVLFNRLLVRGRLRHLQLVVALADAGSVHRAAQLIGISQPAATQLLSDLERQLGTPLFERHARGVRPNPLGQSILPTLRSMLQALRSSTETLATLQRGAQAVLKLGCIPAAAASLLRHAIPGLLRDHPDLQIELSENSSEHLLPELASGRLDAVLCRRPTNMPSHWRMESMLEDAPLLIASPNHPLADASQVSLDTLLSYRWILPLAGMGIRHYFEQLWSRHPHAPAIHPLSTTSLPVGLEVLRHADALMLLPRSAAGPLIEWGAVVPLAVALPPAQGEAERVLGTIGLLCSSAEDSPALLALRSHLRSLGQAGSLAPLAQG